MEILEFDFKEEEFISKCCSYVSVSSNTIADDIYNSLISFLKPKFISNDYEINEVKHYYCNDYYDKNLSLQDYIEKGSLSFHYHKFVISTSINTFLNIEKVKLPSFINLDSIDYGYGITRDIKVKEQNLKTKNKTTITLLTIILKKNILIKIFEELKKLNNDILLPSYLGPWEWRQTFYYKIKGDVYFCSCFKNAIDRTKDELVISNTHQHITKALENGSFKNSICHICTNENSDLRYCSKMYGSEVKVRYGSYIKKLEIEKGISERDAENEIRVIKNIAKIGEKWVNETILFNYINILFSKYDVVREASPEWIGRQRLDIYIPELSVAVEYQGEQHFKAVSIFGGEEGLKKAKDKDKLKKLKCKENKITLIYFTYKEHLSEKLVVKKLKKFLMND